MLTKSIMHSKISFSNTMRYDLEKQKGIMFEEIHRFQGDDGEILSFRSSTEGMENPERVKNVFVTALILVFLDGVKIEDQKFTELVKRASTYLLENRQSEYIWKFFGKDSKIVADIDDTIVILSALQLSGVVLDYNALSKQYLKNRNSEKIFFTWFPEKGESNNVDWVVNANAYLHYMKNGISLNEIKNYLIGVIELGEYKNGSHYYHSFHYFLYVISEIYLVDKDFGVVAEIILKVLLTEGKNENQNTTFLALDVITLLNFGYSKHFSLIEKSEKLLERVSKNEIGMYSVFRHRSIQKFYGGKALTNSIVLKAIHKITNAH